MAPAVPGSSIPSSGDRAATMKPRRPTRRRTTRRRIDHRSPSDHRRGRPAAARRQLQPPAGPDGAHHRHRVESRRRPDQQRTGQPGAGDGRRRRPRAARCQLQQPDRVGRKIHPQQRAAGALRASRPGGRWRHPAIRGAAADRRQHWRHRGCLRALVSQRLRHRHRDVRGRPGRGLGQVRITAPSAENAASIGANPNGRADKDGKFTLNGVPAGLHWIRSGGAPRGWSLKSVIVDGLEVVDTPIALRSGQTLQNVSVVFTNKLTEINGTVTDTRGNPLTEFTVLAFPTESLLWRPLARQIATARPDQNGKFQLRVCRRAITTWRPSIRPNRVNGSSPHFWRSTGLGRRGSRSVKARCRRTISGFQRNEVGLTYGMPPSGARDMPRPIDPETCGTP